MIAPSCVILLLAMTTDAVDVIELVCLELHWITFRHRTTSFMRTTKGSVLGRSNRCDEHSLTLSLNLIET